MRQSWGKLLFMHWPIPPALLRPLIPARLNVDTFNGAAWIGVVPFTMWGVRPTITPSVPRLSHFHELNVRTYVHLDGVPGVWFLSLEATNPIAVWIARKVFHLPYFNSRIDLRQRERTITYTAHRTHRGAPPAEFAAEWVIGDALPPTEPDTLAYFLTERYCLYAARGRKLYRGRILHQPWTLHQAELSAYRSTMIESHGLPTPEGEPLLHYAEALHVGIWRLVKV